MERINPEWAKGIPCRNITIHGYCKYEGKGCSFSHDDGSKKPVAASTANSANDIKNLTISDSSLPRLNASATTMGSPLAPEPTRKKFNASTASFTPSSHLSKRVASPKLGDLPSFIPSASLESFNNDQSSLNRAFNPDSPAFKPSLQTSPQMHNPYLQDQQEPPQVPQFNPYSQSNDQLGMYPGNNQYMLQQQAPPPPPPPQQPQFQPGPPPPQSFPLQYHLYAPAPPPHLQAPLKGNEENAQSLFIPNHLREALTLKNEDTLRVLPHSNLPEFVDVYYDLYPLDKTLDKSNKTYGYTNSLFKAYSNMDGHVYTLRRIENVQISKDMSVATINQWKGVHNANVARVADAFTTRAFGDCSLIIVYDFYPSAKTLDELHVNPIFGKLQPVTNDVLWTYLIQISTALAAIHAKKLAARSVSLQKVILTSKNRVRLSDVGATDILQYDDNQTSEDLARLQEQDLTQLGKLILQLAATKATSALKSLPDLELVQKLDIVDPELQTALKYLLTTDSTTPRTISEFQRIIASRLFKEFNKIENNADFYESQLTRELENARLVRLMSKINFIVGRQDLASSLAPTGDKYPITLFQHYVFHQVDEQGKPVLDLSHVLRCLNKLDVGVEEKILLVSPDEQNCLIVSYREMKDLIARTFSELLKESNQ